MRKIQSLNHKDEVEELNDGKNCKVNGITKKFDEATKFCHYVIHIVKLSLNLNLLFREKNFLL